jgi:hypothetical protein
MHSRKRNLVEFLLALVISASFVVSVRADVLTLTVSPGRPAVASARVNDNDDRYYEVYLHAKVTVLIEIEGSATFTIYGRKGNAQGALITEGTTNWEDNVPADGWYDITVKTDGGSQKYKLSLTAE